MDRQIAEKKERRDRIGRKNLRRDSTEKESKVFLF